MPVFAVTAPHLSPDQHADLETRLLAVAGVDAFFNEEDALGTEVTCPQAALPEVTRLIFAWAARYERGESVVMVTCPGGVVQALEGVTPAALADFLALCSDESAALQGLTKRLADDGVHEGR